MCMLSVSNGMNTNFHRAAFFKLNGENVIVKNLSGIVKGLYCSIVKF